MRMRWGDIFAAVGVIVIAMVSRDGLAQTTTTRGAIGSDSIVAKGKGLEIKRSKMEAVFANYKANSGEPDQAFSQEVQVRILNQLIDIQLVLKKGTEADRAEGKAEGEKTFGEIVRSFESREAFEGRLKSAGMTVEKLRAMVEEEAVARVALPRELGIRVTDAEVKASYESRGPGAYDVPEMAHVREMVIVTSGGVGLSADQLKAKHDFAEGLLKRVRAGEDFAALARRYSEDVFSRDRGGELPAFARDQAEIGDTAFSMKPGGVSEIITCSDGYHIIKVLDFIPAKTATLANVAERIRNFLTVKETRELAPSYLAKLRKEEGVEILDAELKKAMEQAEAKAAGTETQPAIP